MLSKPNAWIFKLQYWVLIMTEVNNLTINETIEEIKNLLHKSTVHR